MRDDRWLRAAALATALTACIGSIVAPRPLGAQVMFFDSAKPITLEEEIARYLPGVSNFQKGLDYYRRGQSTAAMEAWEVSARWAMKDAQYNLGLAYFKGNGVPADRPRGLAWLALAAERKNPAVQASLATAWDSATEAEHQQANAIWCDLKKQYGDEVALPRAQKRFDTELGQLNGSRVGSGNSKVVSRTMGTMDASAYRAKLKELAEQNFGAASGSAAADSGDAAKGKDAG